MLLVLDDVRVLAQVADQRGDVRTEQPAHLQQALGVIERGAVASRPIRHAAPAAGGAKRSLTGVAPVKQAGDPVGDPAGQPSHRPPRVSFFGGPFGQPAPHGVALDLLRVHFGEQRLRQLAAAG